MVLADDLDNNGRLDLLVSTMNGNVYCFETPSEYHPLKTWTSQVTQLVLPQAVADSEYGRELWQLLWDSNLTHAAQQLLAADRSRTLPLESIQNLK
jgi:hypothetical protein